MNTAQEVATETDPHEDIPRQFFEALPILLRDGPVSVMKKYHRINRAIEQEIWLVCILAYYRKMPPEETEWFTLDYITDPYRHYNGTQILRDVIIRRKNNVSAKSNAFTSEQITDVDKDSDMETFTLEIDNAPSVRFTGELVASAASSDDQAMGSSYSGQTGRWTELAMYKTKGGKFVCHQVGRTRWQGEGDRFSGKVCETLEEVKEFFGNCWLANDLYAEANIDDTVEVE